ncbi:hypothetical protein F3J16_06255, partial [Burkholderia sp. Ap-962]|nr:hypothetical protein [Burkholderia sp. Ap-962]
RRRPCRLGRRPRKRARKRRRRHLRVRPCRRSGFPPWRPVRPCRPTRRRNHCPAIRSSRPNRARTPINGPANSR